MKYYYLLFLIGLFSCNNQPNEQDSLKATAFYMAIHTEILHYKPIQQQFLDKSAEALSQLKADTNAVTDTKELHILLDSAKVANRALKAKIDLYQEPDAAIRYKAKTVACTQVADKCYNNDFPELLRLLETKEPGRVQKIIGMSTRLQGLKKTGDDCTEAANALREKYKIPD